MIQITEQRASTLFERGHSILIKSEQDSKGIHWDNRDANTLGEITSDWYFDSDGELTYWTETQSTHIGKE